MDTDEAEGIKIKCSPSPTSLQAVTHFSSNSCLKK